MKNSYMKNGYESVDMDWKTVCYDEDGNFYNNYGNMIEFTDLDYPAFEVKRRNMGYTPDWMWMDENEVSKYEEFGY